MYRDPRKTPNNIWTRSESHSDRRGTQDFCFSFIVLCLIADKCIQVLLVNYGHHSFSWGNVTTNPFATLCEWFVTHTQFNTFPLCELQRWWIFLLRRGLIWLNLLQALSVIIHPSIILPTQSNQRPFCDEATATIQQALLALSLFTWTIKSI